MKEGNGWQVGSPVCHECGMKNDRMVGVRVDGSLEVGDACELAFAILQQVVAAGGPVYEVAYAGEGDLTPSQRSEISTQILNHATLSPTDHVVHDGEPVLERNPDVSLYSRRPDGSDLPESEAAASRNSPPEPS